MIAALIKDDMVVNLIVVDTEYADDVAAALGCEAVDARPYGLCVGDLRTANGWTRNAGGEQMILPLLEGENYDSYTVMAEKVAKLEAERETVAEIAVVEATVEALAILTGEVDE